MEVQPSILEELEAHIVYLLEEDNPEVLVLYYHHGIHDFCYYHELDRPPFLAHMTRLKRKIVCGEITSISSGETININGINLYPMDVVFDGAPCEVYRLLRRQEYMTSDDSSTPYFFRSEQKRNEVITDFMSFTRHLRREGWGPRGWTLTMTLRR